MQLPATIALVVITHCFIHTERDTVVPTPGGPPDLYEYMQDGQPHLCASIAESQTLTNGIGHDVWTAYNEPNNLTKTFTTRAQAQEWVETMCKVMR